MNIHENNVQVLTSTIKQCIMSSMRKDSEKGMFEMGRFVNWFFGISDQDGANKHRKTEESEGIRSVDEMRQSILASTVAHRQAMAQAIENTLDGMLPKIDSLIYRNFSSGTLHVSIKTRNGSAKAFEYEMAEAEPYRLPQFNIHIGRGFYANDGYHAFGDDNDPYEYLAKLCETFKKTFNEKGFTISHSKEQEKGWIEFHINWRDKTFDRAMSEFDDESQIHALQKGVPLEDILA